MKIVSNSNHLDGFKLMVATILLLICILLLLRPLQSADRQTAYNHEKHFPPPPNNSERHEKPAVAENQDRRQDENPQKPPLVSEKDAEKNENKEGASQTTKTFDAGSLPAFPEAPLSLTFFPQDGTLRNPDGTIVYRLDEKSKQWVPEITDELKSHMPDGSEIRWNGSEWVITRIQETVYYRWDDQKMTWVAEKPLQESNAYDLDESSDQSDDASLSIEPGLCPTALASRLSDGMNVKTLRPLNQRSEPVINNNILRTNLSGTQLEIIDGPQCTPHLDRAYLWWQVKSSDNTTGWSAEGSLYGNNYFLEAVP